MALRWKIVRHKPPALPPTIPNHRDLNGGGFSRTGLDQPQLTQLGHHLIRQIIALAGINLG